MAGMEAAERQGINGALLLISALVGAATAYLSFVLLLQTPAVSSARLLTALVIFAAASVAHYLLGGKWLLRKAPTAGSVRAMGSALLLVTLFFPLLYRPPAYPISPLLRPWSDLAVQFQVPAGSEPVVLSPENIKLVMGKEALNTSAFQLVGPWQESSSGLRLAPGDTASLRWTGTLPETTVLSIQPPGTEASLTIYWDNTRTASKLHAGAQDPSLIYQKVSLPWGFNWAFLISLFVLAAWAIGVAALLLAGRLAPIVRFTEGGRFYWGALVLSILLGILTAWLQLGSLNGGMQFLTTAQLARHAAVLRGQAPDPWQYRVLSEVVAEGMVRIFEVLGAKAALITGFVTLRLLQNIAIFVIAWLVYKKITGSNGLALLGILILTGSMLNAYYDNDLSFNTYFDLLFYLLCILLLLSRKMWGIVILTLFAALNRETSGLIPFVMAGAVYGDNTRQGLRKYMAVLLSLAVFILVFVGLRLVFPPRPLYVVYHQALGIPLLMYNLTRAFTWQQLLTTLGLVPLVGMLFFSSWPRLWQRLFLVVCPAWFLVHSFASVMAETRLFLVPQAIIFIPGALFAMQAWLNAREPAAIPSSHYQPGAS